MRRNIRSHRFYFLRNIVCKKLSFKVESLGANPTKVDVGMKMNGYL